MTPTDYRAEAEGLFAQLVAWRRDLHRHPELSFQEVRTSGIVAQTLSELGYEVRTGVARTGVVALLHGGRPGPTVMLRADMDALPIQEISEASYASACPGVMHACGHDGHVAIGLGTATLLARHAAELAGDVLFVFQPAEERDGGAAAMIAAGALADPQPDAAFGLHLWNSLPAGRVVAQAGPIMAAADILKIVVRGKGGHGGQPHETVDAIAVTGQVLSALQTIVSRNVNPQDTAVLSIGMVHGGTAFNIIAETVELQGTLRTFSAGRARDDADAAAGAAGWRHGGHGRRVRIDRAAADRAGHQRSGRPARSPGRPRCMVVGSTAVAWHPPLMVSEDFAEYGQCDARLFPAARIGQRRAGAERGAS